MVSLGLNTFYLYFRITFKERWNQLKNYHLGPQNVDLCWWGTIKGEAVIAGFHCMYVCMYVCTYSTGIKELVIRREAISLQLQGYEIWNFSVVCTYSTPTPHKGLELFRAIFVFGCQKNFFSKNCYCRLKNLFQKLSFMLDIGNAKSYKFHFLKNIFRQFLRERH